MNQVSEGIFSKQKNEIRTLLMEKDTKRKKTIALNKMIKELKSLCDKLDPYSGATEEQKVVLSKYHILPDTDPFTMTNQLLVLMEDALGEKENLRNL